MGARPRVSAAALVLADDSYPRRARVTLGLLEDDVFVRGRAMHRERRDTLRERERGHGGTGVDGLALVAWEPMRGGRSEDSLIVVCAQSAAVHSRVSAEGGGEIGV